MLVSLRGMIYRSSDWPEAAGASKKGHSGYAAVASAIKKGVKKIISVEENDARGKQQLTSSQNVI